ncbi:hypothetical protein C8J55DRAFT_408405, partial [Lentinula edodes]
LRKEYRELEILDEITRLKYENLLDPSVVGNTRNLLIESFLAWKGANFVPSQVHTAVKWSDKDPYSLQSEELPSWSKIDKKAITIRQRKMSLGDKLRRSSAARHASLSHNQRNRDNTIDTVPRQSSVLPIALQWSNNSCAFDSVLSILIHIW